VRLTFLGHSSFLIETPDGVSAVTDYNGYYRPDLVPTIVTMNNAHSSHYTFDVDPGVKHVLRGWPQNGGWAQHDVEEGDLRVRNIPTAVHGRTGDQALGNSIFVFETPDLCIAHLGHLHHVLTEDQVAELGQIDILLVPIDGGYTMAQELMVEVIEQIRPSLVIPMHYFASTLVGRFASLVDESWDVRTSSSPSVTLTRADLPYRQVLVLPGG
jgi:L-ascorbate metabolism protein UlaG (beta-lactamase superfamily)